MKMYRIDYEARTDEGIKTTSLILEDEDKDPVALSNFIKDLYESNDILSFTLSTINAGSRYNPKQLHMFGED